MKPTRRIKRRPVPRNCPFCHENNEPDFRDTEMLRRYVSERGKIQSHARTGVCSKHQRSIATAIKHARHIALLPFVGK